MSEDPSVLTPPKGVVLEPGENLRLINHQHWFVFRNSFLLSFFCPFVSLSSIFLIDHSRLPFWLASLLMQVLLILSFVCFIAGGLLFFWRLFLWSRTYYLVTNRRLILVTQRGLFAKDRRETSLEMIQDVKAEVNGLQAALYGFGDVIVQISSKEAQLIFEKVGQPYLAQRIIMKEAHLGAQEGTE